TPALHGRTRNFREMPSANASASSSDAAPPRQTLANNRTRNVAEPRRQLSAADSIPQAPKSADPPASGSGTSPHPAAPVIVSRTIGNLPDPPPLQPNV